MGSVCTIASMISVLLVVFLLSILPYLIWGNHIGRTTTAYWDFGDDFCYSRRHCLVPATETFSTPIMGRCRDNNTETEQTEKKII